MSKLTLMTAAAAGYVLGTRAGRERYEQIAAGARSVMRNPKVQAARQQAQGVVAEQAATVKDAATQKARVTASSVADKVRSNNGGSHAAAGSWPADTSAPAS
jgi:hypothetical protein